MPIETNPLLPPVPPKSSTVNNIFIILAWGVSLFFGVMILIPLVTTKDDPVYDQGVVDFYISQGYDIHCVNKRIIAARAHIILPEEPNHKHSHDHKSHGHNVEHPFDINGNPIKCKNINRESIKPFPNIR